MPYEFRHLHILYILYNDIYESMSLLLQCILRWNRFSLCGGQDWYSQMSRMLLAFWTEEHSFSKLCLINQWLFFLHQCLGSEYLQILTYLYVWIVYCFMSFMSYVFWINSNKRNIFYKTLAISFVTGAALPGLLRVLDGRFPSALGDVFYVDGCETYHLDGYSFLFILVSEMFRLYQ